MVLRGCAKPALTTCHNNDSSFTSAAIRSRTRSEPPCSYLVKDKSAGRHVEEFSAAQYASTKRKIAPLGGIGVAVCDRRLRVAASEHFSDAALSIVLEIAVPMLYEGSAIQSARRLDKPAEIHCQRVCFDQSEMILYERYGDAELSLIEFDGATRAPVSSNAMQAPETGRSRLSFRRLR